jgi:hypothetical protein
MSTISRSSGGEHLLERWEKGNHGLPPNLSQAACYDSTGPDPPNGAFSGLWGLIRHEGGTTLSGRDERDFTIIEE